MLYIISPLLTYFITGSLYLLSPFAQFCPPSTPPGSHREEAVSSQYLSQVFVFQIPHISETIWCLSFFDLLHLFSIKYFYLTAFGAGICFQPRKIRIKKKKLQAKDTGHTPWPLEPSGPRATSGLITSYGLKMFLDPHREACTYSF